MVNQDKLSPRDQQKLPITETTSADARRMNKLFEEDKMSISNVMKKMDGKMINYTAS